MPFYSRQFTGAKRRLVAKTDNFYYIPLLDTLKSLLSMDSIVNEITEPRLSIVLQARSFLGGERVW